MTPDTLAALDGLEATLSHVVYPPICADALKAIRELRSSLARLTEANERLRARSQWIEEHAKPALELALKTGVYVADVERALAALPASPEGKP